MILNLFTYFSFFVQRVLAYYENTNKVNVDCSVDITTRYFDDMKQDPLVVCKPTCDMNALNYHRVSQ